MPSWASACTAAAASKLRVGLVDLYAEPGGQYAMAASHAFPIEFLIPRPSKMTLQVRKSMGLRLQAWGRYVKLVVL